MTSAQTKLAYNDGYERGAAKELARIAAYLEAHAAQHKEASRNLGNPGCHWERADELEFVAREIRSGVLRDGAHREETS